MTEERNFEGHGGGRFGAFVALPRKLPAPALVLLQEVYGVNRFMRRITESWAAQGFFAVCPDVYWRLKPGIVLDPETPGHREQGRNLCGLARSALRLAPSLPELACTEKTAIRR